MTRNVGLPLALCCLLASCAAENEVKTTASTTQGSQSPTIAENPHSAELDNVEPNNRFDSLIDTYFEEFPILARVAEDRITYPEWIDSDPNDYFEEAVSRHHVRVLEVLNGELPDELSYLVYREAEIVPLQSEPYLVALCKDGEDYVSDVMIGKPPMHIEGFEELLTIRLKEEVEVTNVACVNFP